MPRVPASMSAAPEPDASFRTGPRRARRDTNLMPRGAWRRLLAMPFTSALVGIGIAGFIWVAGRSLFGLSSVCLWNNLSIVPCWACGLGSGTVALLRADPATAIAAHPLSPLVLALITWCVFRSALEVRLTLRARPAPRSAPSTAGHRAP